MVQVAAVLAGPLLSLVHPLEEADVRRLVRANVALPFANSTKVSGSFDCVSLTRMMPQCVISLMG